MQRFKAEATHKGLAEKAGTYHRPGVCTALGGLVHCPSFAVFSIEMHNVPGSLQKPKQRKSSDSLQKYPRKKLKQCFY